MKSNWSRLLQECSYFSVMSQSIRTMFLGFSCCTTLGEIWDISGSGWGCTELYVCTQWLHVSVLTYSDAKGRFEYVMVACSTVSRCQVITHRTPTYWVQNDSTIHKPVRHVLLCLWFICQHTELNHLLLFVSYNFSNKWHHCWYISAKRKPFHPMTWQFVHDGIWTQSMSL